MIHLEEITPENWREDLHVSASQQHYVAARTALLARAYAFRNHRSQAHFLCDGDTPVGMSLYYDLPTLNAYCFSQLFIDERYQRRGYGRVAARLILERMRQDGRYRKVVLCYIEGNEAARRLYETLGFAPNGERDEDEIVMELHF